MTTFASSEPLVSRLPDGAVAVSFDDGATHIQFRTAGHWNHVREQLDREQASYEGEAWERYGHARDQWAAAALEDQREREIAGL